MKYKAGDFVLTKNRGVSVPRNYQDGAFEVVTEAGQCLTGCRAIRGVGRMVSVKGIGYVNPNNLEVI